MMANDWQRLNIWLKLSNRFNYAEYSQACKTANIEPHNALEFAQKAGMVSTGIAAYPELSPPDAYLKFIADNQVNQTAAAPTGTQQQPTRPKPCCGGGTVK